MVVDHIIDTFFFFDKNLKHRSYHTQQLRSQHCGRSDCKFLDGRNVFECGVNDTPLNGILCLQIMVVGVAFAILQFIPRVEPPSNMKRQTYDDTMQGYYNYPPQTGGGDAYQQSGYYGQNTGNTANPQSYNVGGVV